MNAVTTNLAIEGLGVSPGLAMGPAYVYHDVEEHENSWYTLAPEQLDEEWLRLREALRHACLELSRSAETLGKQVSTDTTEIFVAHQAILDDPMLLRELKETLYEQGVNAECVVKLVFDRWRAKLERLSSDEEQERLSDLDDLRRQLLDMLGGIRSHRLAGMPEGSVLVARRLLPSDTVYFSGRGTSAIVSEFGGRASHAAILTREIGIPGVMQAAGILDEVETGDTVFVDGDSGKVVVRPDQDTANRLGKRLETSGRERARGLDLCHQPARRPCGQRIMVSANVGCEWDVRHAAEYGADAIGLYRIEHDYLTRQTPPGDEELLADLIDSLEPMRDRPIVLRLLDAGGDKQTPYLHTSDDPNPSLGQRGIRLLRDHPDILDAQLRAFLQLSEGFDIYIMIPLVTIVDEVVEVRQRLRHFADRLNTRRLPPLGAMIETPAAALCARELARETEFLSVGSNDLAQYTMVAGRENPAAAEYYLDEHPAMLRLLKMVVDEAGSTPVSLCGELAGRLEALPKLLDIGITCLSVAPPLIPRVKQAIRRL